MMAPYRSNVEREMHSLRAARRADKQVSQRRTALYYGWLVVGASFVIVLLNTGGAEQFWQLPQTNERDVWLGPGNDLHTRSARDLAEWPVSAL